MAAIYLPRNAMVIIDEWTGGWNTTYTNTGTNPWYNIWNQAQTGATSPTLPWNFPRQVWIRPTSSYHEMYMNQPLWEDVVTPTQYYDLARQRVYICRERSEAEAARLAEEQRQREARARIAQEQYRLAGSRARDLLVAHLTKEQRKSFEDKGWFIVKGGQSGQSYKIHTKSYSGNVEILKGDRAISRLCCHADGIPMHDHHLAQMVALKYDEERFLRIANHTRLVS